MSKKHKRLPAGRPQPDTRVRKRRYLVVTNGEVTEPGYFKYLESEIGHAVFTIRTSTEDPSSLANLAYRICSRERESGTSSLDGVEAVFVVTDVDAFTASQFQSAQHTCKRGEMELVISNPCFEVWIIDHLTVCPESCSVTKEAERKAKDLGLVGGSRNKYVTLDAIDGQLTNACVNAARHNTEERRKRRETLGRMDFGPWTDMPKLIERVDNGAQPSGGEC